MSYIVLIVYVLFIVGISYQYRSKKMSEKDDYFVAQRTMGIVDVALSSVAAVVSPFGILIAFGVAAMFGAAGYGLHIAFFAVFFIAAMLAERFYKRIHEAEAYTLADYIKYVVGKKSQYVYTAITVLGMVGVIIGAFTINIQLLEQFLDMGRIPATILSFGVVLGYLLLAGYRGVVKTDVVQFIIMATFLLGVVMSLGFSATVPSMSGVSQWFGGSFWVVASVFFFVNIANPAMWQPVLGAQSAKVAKKGLLLGGSLITLLMLPMVWISFLLLENLPTAADPTTLLFDSLGALLSPGFAILIFVGLYAAMMSTLDTALFYSATHIVHNLMPKRVHARISHVYYVKVVTVVLAIVSVVLSWLVPSFITFIMNISPLVGTVAGVFILSMFIKIPDIVGATSMSLGALVFAYLFIIEPTNYAFFAIPSLVSIGIVLGAAAVSRVSAR